MQSGSVDNTGFSAQIFSCGIGERAFEWPGKNRGFFSLALEEALSGLAGGGDGQVTLNEIESYLHRRVPELVVQNLGPGKKQLPWVDRSGAGAGDFVLAGSGSVSQLPLVSSETYSQPPTPPPIITQEFSNLPTNQKFPWFLPEGLDPFDVESSPFRKSMDGKTYLKKVSKHFEKVQNHSISIES